jgi:hypothetical protein
VIKIYADEMEEAVFYYCVLTKYTKAYIRAEYYADHPNNGVKGWRSMITVKDNNKYCFHNSRKEAEKFLNKEFKKHNYSVVDPKFLHLK